MKEVEWDVLLLHSHNKGMSWFRGGLGIGMTLQSCLKLAQGLGFYDGIFPAIECFHRGQASLFSWEQLPVAGRISALFLELRDEDQCSTWQCSQNTFTSVKHSIGTLNTKSINWNFSWGKQSKSKVKRNNDIRCLEWMLKKTKDAQFIYYQYSHNKTE